MAKLKNGILGDISGKVGSGVGLSWKGISSIRAHVVPANPNTPAQQTQRSKMSLCVAFIKAAIGPVLNVYQDPITQGKSAYNVFVSNNIALFEGTVPYNSVALTTGKLFAPQIVNVFPPAPGSDYDADFNTGLGSNGLDSDVIYGGAYHKVTGAWYFPDSPVVRSDGKLTFSGTADESSSDLVFFLFASQSANLTIKSISTSYGYTI